MYPFIYLFWPKAVKMERRTVSKADDPDEPSFDYVTVYSDSDDEIESAYPEGIRSLAQMRSLVKSYTYSVTSPTIGKRT